MMIYNINYLHIFWMPRQWTKVKILFVVTFNVKCMYVLFVFSKSQTLYIILLQKRGK